MYLLSVRHLSKAFPQGERTFYALSNIDLAFPERGLFAIVGKSGSGKSTLLNLLSRLDKPSAGYIRFKDEDIFSPSFKKHYAANVFQHYLLLGKMSSFDNVAMALKILGRRGIRKKTNEALRKVGLDRLKEKNVDLLSGGEKQRVAIARAIVSDPEILFADEPTGALDENNAETVMKILSQEGKRRLVILVTHNEEYVHRYCDGYVRLKGGKIVERKIPIKKAKESKSTKAGHGLGWRKTFLWRNLKGNFAKNLICLFAGILGFSALLLSLGFYSGQGKALEKQKRRSLLYPTSYLYEQDRFEVENSPLSLLRQIRPSMQTALDLTEGIKGLTFETDYSFFFPESLSFKLDEVSQDPVRFAPVYDLTLKEGGGDLLIKGKLPRANTMGECLVNEEFISFYQSEVGDLIEVSNIASIEKDGAKEDIILDFEMKISGVVKEFSFLNSPRVYYSYQALASQLQSYPLDNIGITGLIRPRLGDFLSLLSSSSPYLNYRYLVFAHDPSEMEKVYDLIRQYEDDRNYGFENETYTVASSFEALSSTFMSALAMMVGLASGSLAIILAMMAFSTYVKKKKEVAILYVLGAKQEDMILIYAGEASFICFLSALGALLVSIPLQEIANRFLEGRFGMDGMIEIPYTDLFGVPYLLIALTLVGAVVFGLLVASIPLVFSHHISLAEVLRDE